MSGPISWARGHTCHWLTASAPTPSTDSCHTKRRRYQRAMDALLPNQRQVDGSRTSQWTSPLPLRIHGAAKRIVSTRPTCPQRPLTRHTLEAWVARLKHLRDHPAERARLGQAPLANYSWTRALKILDGIATTGLRRRASAANARLKPHTVEKARESQVNVDRAGTGRPETVFPGGENGISACHRASVGVEQVPETVLHRPLHAEHHASSSPARRGATETSRVLTSVDCPRLRHRVLANSAIPTGGTARGSWLRMSAPAKLRPLTDPIARTCSETGTMASGRRTFARGPECRTEIERPEGLRP